VVLRSLALTGLLATAACGFTVPDGGATGDDVAPGDDTQNPPPVERKCALTDPALRLCIDFDDDQTLTSDGSGRGHDAVGTGYMVTTRKAEQAVMVNASTQLVVAETPDLDIPNNLTVTLMARPSSYPATGQAYWAVDNNKQYFISYQHDGKFRCGIGNMVVDSSVGVAKDSWYQVACTYERGQLKLFIEGQLAGCRKIPDPIPVDGTEGLAIGGNIGAGSAFSEQFIGGLDNIQVFARAYTMDELCSAAGKTGCWQGWGGFGGPGGPDQCD
jgi:hypothetical protein